MAQRIYRIVFLLFIAAGAIRLSAQTKNSDVGVWLVGSNLAESVFVDEGDRVTTDFDESLGYGVSFNHFWTDHFSTEFAAQKYSADVNLSVDSATGDFSFDAGELDVTSITAMAQLHFRRAARFSPYIGAGLAHLSGEFDPSDDLDDGDVAAEDLDSETTWAAAVGANVRITDNVFLVGEMKYVPWDANAESDLTGEATTIDPTTFAAGVKFRF